MQLYHSHFGPSWILHLANSRNLSTTFCTANSHLWKESCLLVELWQLRLVDDVGGDQLLDLPPLGARHPHLLLGRRAGVIVDHLKMLAQNV